MDYTKIAIALKTNQENKTWAEEMAKILPSYKIDNNIRLAHFLAQICHESNYCLQLTENLNYTSLALLKIWPKYFNSDLANKYGRNNNHSANQEAIANIAYANRLGNGDVASKDGFKYRGRGLIQITGKSNYQDLSQHLFGNNNLLDNPDLLSNNKEISIKSACWFWQKNNLNALADQENIIAITKIINGGQNGLEHRKQILQEIEKICAVNASVVDENYKFSLPNEN
jgi:putative chitinase